MGMSLDDFDRCTPLEFERIFEIWHEAQEMDYRTGWEQTRQLACCILQPYSKKALRPTDVMEFAWDKPKKKKAVREKTPAEREAEQQHYLEVKKARGLS